MARFDLFTTTKGGMLALDVSDEVLKKDRVTHMTGAARVLKEDEPGLGALQASELADPANAFTWRCDPEKLAPRGGFGSWSFAMPAIFGVSNDAEFTEDRLYPWERYDETKADFRADSDFLGLIQDTPLEEDGFRFLKGNWSGLLYVDTKIPRDIDVIALATTGHGLRDIVAAPIGGPLVADHASDAPGAYSRHVFDIDQEGRLSRPTSAPLHSHLRVAQQAGVSDEWTAAWNLTKSVGDGTGWGAFVSAGVGQEGDFVTVAGAGTDREEVVFVPREETTNILAYASWERFGPLHPGSPVGDKHQHGVTESGMPTQSGHIWTNALYYRDTEHDGPFEFQARNVPRLRDGGTPTRVHLVWDPDKIHPWEGGAKSGRWVWYTTVPGRSASPPWATPEGVITPDEDPANNPAVPCNETVITPDGTFVGPGLEPGQAPGQNPIVITDPFSPDSGFITPGPGALVEDQIIPVASAGAPGVGEELELEEGFALQGMDTGFMAGFAGIRLKAARSTLQPYDGRFGGGYDSQIWADLGPSPFIANIECWSATASNGKWAKTEEHCEAAKIKDGTASGGLRFAPPEVFIDGTSSPSTVSTLVVSFHPDVLLGWGDPVLSDGTLKDGPLYSIDGASGIRDLMLDFTDAAGVARTDGLLTINGEVSSPSAGNTNSETFGQDAFASTDGTALGRGANASAGVRNTAIGRSAICRNLDSVAVGYQADASGARSSAFGRSALAGTETVSVGMQAIADVERATCVGFQAITTEDDTICIGNRCSVGGENGYAIGSEAVASDVDAYAAGNDAAATMQAAYASGNNADSSAEKTFAAGNASVASFERAFAVGNSSLADSESALAVGNESMATDVKSVVVGNSATVAHAASIVFGYGATSTAANQFVVGDVGAGVTDGYFGEGVTSASPGDFHFHATGGSGTNIAGGDLFIDGAQSTGAAESGEIIFRVASRDVSSSTPNALAEALRIVSDDSGADRQNKDIMLGGVARALLRAGTGTPHDFIELGKDCDFRPEVNNRGLLGSSSLRWELFAAAADILTVNAGTVNVSTQIVMDAGTNILVDNIRTSSTGTIKFFETIIPEGGGETIGLTGNRWAKAFIGSGGIDSTGSINCNNFTAAGGVTAVDAIFSDDVQADGTTPFHAVNMGSSTGTDVIISSGGFILKKSSTRRIKNDITPWSVPGDNWFDRLSPQSFTYKADKTRRVDVGFIAEDLVDVFPESVNYNRDGEPESYSTQPLIAALVSEVQSLRKRVKTLEAAA